MQVTNTRTVLALATLGDETLKGLFLSVFSSPMEARASSDVCCCPCSWWFRQ